jgi:O-antigen/teichoic acid export membrane protein
MASAQRIVLNALTLYAKVVVVAGLSLLSTRLILRHLGVVDFGLFSVLGGVVGLLVFLNTAMSVSTQRHLAYELGRGDLERANMVFNACVIIHLAVAAVVILLGETVGLWIFHSVLKIPEARRTAAQWVYQFVLVSAVVNIANVPYKAVLVAREAMIWISVLNILQTLLLFLTALALGWLGGDRLIWYAAAVAAISLMILLATLALCNRKYPEGRFRVSAKADKTLVREIAGFSGWNLFGALAGVGRIQGIAVLLNMFFGAVVNAAYGLANQVSSQLATGSHSLLFAVNPQIVKREGAGDRGRMLNLAMRTSKYSFFAVSFFAVPVIVEMPVILNLWLDNPPHHAVAFCRLALLIFLVDQLTVGVMFAMQAIGRIALYQATIGGILLANVALAYGMLKFGLPPESALWCGLAISILAGTGRLIFLQHTAGQPILEWLRRVVVRSTIGMTPSCLGLLPLVSMPPSLVRLLGTALLCFLGAGLGIWFLGTDRFERQFFVKMFKEQILRRLGLTEPSRVQGDLAPSDEDGLI